MFAGAHRSQMRGATSKSLFASIQAAREHVPPQADAALAATVKTRIAVARVFGCAIKASHQAGVSTFQSTSHVEVPHAELPQCARGFLAKDVACGCRRDALTCKQDDAFGAFRGESGECASVGPGQPLASNDPPRGPTAFSRRERMAAEVRGMDGVNGLRKTGPVDQHAPLHQEGVGRLPLGTRCGRKPILCGARQRDRRCQPNPTEIVSDGAYWRSTVTVGARYRPFGWGWGIRVRLQMDVVERERHIGLDEHARRRHACDLIPSRQARLQP